jgi:hypothetical protein
MAYNKGEILDIGLQAIKDNEITDIVELIDYLPCSESTLYSDEEWKVEVLEPFKKAVGQIKVRLKAKMKKAWRKEEANPTLQIAAFKLMADEDELTRLNTSKVHSEISGRNGAPIEQKLTVEILRTNTYDTK